MIFDLLKTLHLVNFRSLIDFVPTPGLYGKEDIAHGGFFDAKLAMAFDGFVFHKPVRCAIIRPPMQAGGCRDVPDEGEILVPDHMTRAVTHTMTRGRLGRRR